MLQCKDQVLGKKVERKRNCSTQIPIMEVIWGDPVLDHTERKEEKVYIVKKESCPCQLMRQYGLNNLRKSQQKIFLASQIGETPSLDALVTF